MESGARLNGAVFRNDYKDYQAFDVVVIDAITTNRDAEMWGFELELVATPAAGLDLLLGVGYNDAEVVLGMPDAFLVDSVWLMTCSAEQAPVVMSSSTCSWGRVRPSASG